MLGTGKTIPQMKFHALRHTYATRLFEAGVPPKTVQALMGHYDISITMDIYTHVMKDSKLEAVEKINDIFELKISRWSYGGHK
ncbi:tyrosine-type recombinase/integrase [Metaclostridioides mangenotii]|uniref:tyrosine-type recombinase/integrase n=1 Tax=Metaclostridioides mangenotii TaxID=1540 RepID=UPI0009DEB0B8|nr:tyrosine-type recombinase/integrase [Clostridioides mangenotii]